MISYRQFIEGYESPESSGEESSNLIDENLTAQKTEDSYSAQLVLQKNEQNETPQKLEENGFKKYDYSSDQKSYRLLDADDLTNFETDIRRGQLNREELCEKYGVSKSTTARFIRNYKEKGYLKARKPKTMKSDKPENITDLISRLMAENPDMTFRDMRRRISELPKTKECLQLQREFFSTFI